jgi:putative membrane protein
MMRRGLVVALGAVAAAMIGWGCFSTSTEIAAVGHGTWHALWTLPLLIAVHLVQLLLSSIAWRELSAPSGPGASTWFRLRLIREGIDSLLPVAQIGGEVIGARLLTRRGINAAQAAASVVVDVSLEVLSQLLFLSMGVATLAITRDGNHLAEWSATLVLAGLMAGFLLLAQRFGALRLLEMLADRIAWQFPDLAGLSLTGMHKAAEIFYRRTQTLLRATLLHLLSWSIGTVETSVVLYALGVPASLQQAMVVESLGMAARTTGFVIPGALAVQEGGFALAAMSVGLPASAGLSLSLVKRVREVLVGFAGLWLGWRDGGFR